ncbi:MAG: hypothetical protein IKY70_01205 [Bacteroidales bacterium]|nr:hypothetical protein [Bacteroidales bacterium]
MKKPESHIIVTALMIIYIAMVLFCCLYNFSSTPNIDIGKYFLGIRADRYIHFTMFLPYPFVMWLFLTYSKYFNSRNNSNSSIIRTKYIFPAILISGLFFATLAEASQELLTQYRDTDPFDFVANITGISVGTLIIYII